MGSVEVPVRVLHSLAARSRIMEKRITTLETSEAKIGLENYCFQLRNALSNGYLQDKSKHDKDKIEEAVRDALSWLHFAVNPKLCELKETREKIEILVTTITRSAPRTPIITPKARRWATSKVKECLPCDAGPAAVDDKQLPVVESDTDDETREMIMDFEMLEISENRAAAASELKAACHAVCDILSSASKGSVSDEDERGIYDALHATGDTLGDQGATLEDLESRQIQIDSILLSLQTNSAEDPFQDAMTETVVFQPVAETTGWEQKEMCATGAKSKEVIPETAAYQPLAEDTGLTELDLINHDFETTLARIDGAFDNAMPKKFQFNAHAETFTPGMGPKFGDPETSHWQDALTLNGQSADADEAFCPIAEEFTPMAAEALFYDEGYEYVRGFGSDEPEEDEEVSVTIAQGSNTYVLEEEEEEEEEEAEESDTDSNCEPLDSARIQAWHDSIQFKMEQKLRVEGRAAADALLDRLLLKLDSESFDPGHQRLAGMLRETWKRIEPSR